MSAGEWWSAALILCHADGNRVVRRPIVNSAGDESVAGEFITLGQLATKRPNGIEYQIRVGGQPVALISRVKNGTTWSSSVRYVHTDEKGTPAAITDGSGNIVDAPRYEPFGERRNPLNLSQQVTTTHAAQVGYTGQDQDDDLGLVNMKGRIYDPKLARFLSPDPILGGGQAMNPFSYVRNSPTNLVDPSGYQPIEFGGSICIGCFGSSGGSVGGSGFMSPNFGSATNLTPSGPNLAGGGFDDQSANRPASLNELATEYTIGVAQSAATGVAFAYGIGYVAGFVAGVTGIAVAAPIIVGVATVSAIAWAGYQLYNGGARAIAESLSHAGSGTMTKGDARVLGKIVGAVITLRFLPGALSAGLDAGGGAGATVRTTLSKTSVSETPSISRIIGDEGTAIVPRVSQVADEILAAERVGSGIKDDVTHRAASYLTKAQLEQGSVFDIIGGDSVPRTLLQTLGNLNEQAGVFEYILDNGKVTHQRFITGGTVTGQPNQRPQ